MKKAATIFVIAALAALGIAACGSDDNNDETTAASTTATAPAGGGGETLAITADPSGKLLFEQKSLNAKAGPITVNFDNPAPLPHDVVIEDSSGQEVGKTDIINQSTASFTATVKAGTYKYFCSLPGHSTTMHGTLTVK